MTRSNLKKTFFGCSLLLSILYSAAIPTKSINIYAFGFGVICLCNGFAAGFCLNDKDGDCDE
jgi:hypothetical protein